MLLVAQYADSKSVAGHSQVKDGLSGYVGNVAVVAIVRRRVVLTSPLSLCRFGWPGRSSGCCLHYCFL
jgi:hypothetical protein